MTKANFSRKGSTYTIEVQGHSGYNRDGPDIVCSACTVLCAALLQAMLTLEKMGKARIIEARPPKDGGFFLCFKGEDPACEACVFTILQGFLLLENSYKNFVQVSPEVGRNDFFPIG